MSLLNLENSLSKHHLTHFIRDLAQDNRTFEILSWQDIRQTCQALIPEITACIDALSPGENWPVLCVQYEYGTPIFEEGHFFLHNTLKHKLSLENLSLEKTYREKFYYPKQLPLGLVLEKNLEARFNTPIQSTPLQCFTPGCFFGLENILPHPQPNNSSYQLLSGTGHIFSVPKIGATTNHNRLIKHLRIKSQAPQHLTDHFKTFTAIAQSPQLNCPWKSRILIFSKPWLEQRKDPAWQSFYYLLLQQWVKQHIFNAHQPLIQILLHDLARHTNRHPDPFLMAHFKQLLTITSNQTPGLCFASHDESAPLSLLKEVYEEIYQLYPYNACFMHAQHIQNNSNGSLYYSLANHSQKEKYHNTKTTSQRQMLLELKELIEQYQEYLRYKQKNGYESFLTTLLSQYVFNFYHPQIQYSENIHSSKDIAKQIEHLLPEEKTFSYASPLLQGIVEIRPQK
jgi:hypothetical protein